MITKMSIKNYRSFAVDALRVVEKEGHITHIGLVDPAQKAIIRDRLLSLRQLMRGQGVYRAEGVYND